MLRGSLLLLLALAPLALAGGGGHGGTGEGSPLFGENETWTATFAAAGEFPYHCHPHPGMKGTVVVREGAPAQANVTIADLAFSPARVEVAPGGNVTWTNADDVEHTVTWAAVDAMGHDQHGASTPGLGLALLAVALVLATVLVRR